MTKDRSTLVTPTLLDPGETPGSLGETWPKQRRHNLNKSQVYPLLDNSDMTKEKKPYPQHLVQHPIRPDKHVSHRP